MNPKAEEQTSDATCVYFDGACPLCRREVAIYQGQRSDGPITWVDVSGDEPALPEGASRAALMRRFHVRTPQGDMLDGAPAFVHLWQQLPGWRWLALPTKLPGGLFVMERCYRAFLRIRPSIQRLFR